MPTMCSREGVVRDVTSIGVTRDWLMRDFTASVFLLHQGTAL
ncbi:MAG: hypothetical protein ACOYJ2_06150 [Rickettsiales bacterium]